MLLNWYRQEFPDKTYRSLSELIVQQYSNCFNKNIINLDASFMGMETDNGRFSGAMRINATDLDPAQISVTNKKYIIGNSTIDLPNDVITATLLDINPNNVEIAPLTDPSTNFYVPCNDGEIVQISGTSFVSYGDKVYRIVNGKYVATAAMLINGKRFTFSGGSIIGMRDLVAAASGDPHVFPIFGKQYDLPNDESCYTLFDNKNKDDPFVITTKLYKIPRSYWVENRIPAFSRFSFFKYVCLQTKNEMMVLDVEAFSPVEYTNAEDMKANNLPAKHEKAFRNSDAFKIHAVQQDRFYFKSYYAEDSQLPLKPTFNGEYRDIDVKTKENVYTVRLYRDNTCINHRTEVRITGSNLHTGTGALIREMECKVDDLF
jgi:hypothetical protein